MYSVYFSVLIFLRNLWGKHLFYLNCQLCRKLRHVKRFSFRYVRMLGALYMRLTGTAIDCYKYLEPLYNDYRKIKSQNRNGGKCFYVVVVSQYLTDDFLLKTIC